MTYIYIYKRKTQTTDTQQVQAYSPPAISVILLLCNIYLSLSLYWNNILQDQKVQSPTRTGQRSLMHLLMYPVTVTACSLMSVCWPVVPTSLKVLQPVHSKQPCRASVASSGHVLACFGTGCTLAWSML